MSYCINPDCESPQNPDGVDHCQACGMVLRLQGRYSVLKRVRPGDRSKSTDLFLVQDGNTQKVLKILKHTSDPKVVELFEREAEALQTLKHPGIPKVDLDGYFNITTSQGKTMPCLVMEKIEGQNLDEWVRQHGAITQKLALNWFHQLLEILDYLHRSGVFHRDIKPSNIMLRSDGNLVLIDFGSIRTVSWTYLANISHSVESTRIISEGYTPPEQQAGFSLPQSDFYALGRTFVHLLTGQPPHNFIVDSEMKKLSWGDSAPQVAKPLKNFIDQLMLDAVEDRPRTAIAVKHQLSTINILIQQVINFLRSPQGISALLIVGLVGLGSYQILTFFNAQRQAQLAQQAELLATEGRDNLVNNNLEVARQSLEQAVFLDSNNPRHHNDLGLVCTYLKDYTCAIEQYQTAIQLDPNSPERLITHYNVGNLYERQQRYEEAIEQYQSIVYPNLPNLNNQTISGQIPWHAASNLSRLELWQNFNADRALEIITPTLDSVENAIQNLQNKTDRSPEEEENLDYLQDLKAALLKNQGWAYLQQGQYPAAEESLDQALNLSPDRASTYCLLAQVQEAQNHDTDALESWRSCVERTSEFGETPEVVTWQGIACQRWTNQGDLSVCESLSDRLRSNDEN